MKRVLLSLILAAALGAITFASAAALTVRSSVAQYGVASAACQTDPVDVHILAPVSNFVTGPVISHVVVTGVQDSCAGTGLWVYLYDSNGNVIYRDSQQVVAGHSTYTFTPGTPINEVSVEHVGVQIYG